MSQFFFFYFLSNQKIFHLFFLFYFLPFSLLGLKNLLLFPLTLRFVSGLLVGEYSHNLCFHFDHNFFGVFSMTYFHFWWFKILLGSLIRWSFGMFHQKNTRVVFRMKDLRLWLITVFAISYVYLVI